MDNLIKSRGYAKGSITRVESRLTKIGTETPSNKNELVICENLLVKAYNDFLMYHEQIVDFASQTEDDEVRNREITKHMQELDQVEDRYIICHAQIKSLLEKFQSTGLIPSSNNQYTPRPTSATPSVSKINIPVLKIPSFSGNHGEWLTFIDLYNASFHNNPGLVDSEKFMHLKTLLKGEALALVNELQTSDANYQKAIKILKDRYDRKLPIINHHINGILCISSSVRGLNDLKEFLSQVNQHINALEAMNVQVYDKWNLLLINIFSNKIDRSLRTEFELSRDQNEYPTLKEFFGFLEKRVIAWESSSSQSFVKNETRKNFSTSHTVTDNNVPECRFCKIKGHTLLKCFKFGALDIQKRRDFVSEKRLCFNCFGKNHGVASCKRERCNLCSGKHNVLLHVKRNSSNLQEQKSTEKKDNTEVSQATTCTDVANTEVSQTLTSCSKKQVLLATAKFHIISKEGKRLQVRGLLDSGSQTSFISSSIVDQLQSKTYQTNLTISGISQSNSKVSKMIDFQIESKNGLGDKLSITCGVLDKITCNLPQQRLDRSSFVLPQDIKLADENFDIPGKIDILIGADLYFDIIEPGIIRLGPNLPILQNSKLGWILGGSLNSPQNSIVSNFCVSLFTQSESKVNDLIQKFWQLEEFSNVKILSQEDKLAEEIFSKTTKREPDGKFLVNLPLKKDVKETDLGNSFNYAKRIFLSLEKRFHKDKMLFDKYKDFINEYIELKHGSYTELSTETKNLQKKYFMPHHAVIREEAVSTKTRVVFNASMKTTSGISLNEIMLKGPTVQSELFDIVCRFRTFKFCFSTDIIKMYRQILINPDQRHLQNILWRESPTEELKCIQLNTVTYGTNCAPFLATRCLVELAKENALKFPLASKCLLEQAYVDDILGGSNLISEFKELQRELTELLRSGGFTLHKWVYNVNIGKEIESETHVDESLNKVLGISWKATSDIFKIRSFSVDESLVLTKRNVLANIASMFDPLGFIGPVVILGKILMQNIWREKLDWDSKLSEELIEEWNSFSKNISSVTDICIPRLLYDSQKEIKYLELHGFSDSSIKAYGTCFYLKAVYTDNSVTCRLICSKSRVAPIKVVTLPRLELCGALLMARLGKRLSLTFELEFSRTVYWSDSEIVLCWLKKSPERWTTFVSNRVSEIQELSSNCEWHHVSSANNPADHISRGLDSVTLQKCDIWWLGPNFLYDLNYIYPEMIESKENVSEEKIIVKFSVNIEQEFMDIFLTFSKFSKLQRTFAYMFRFICCLKNKKKIQGPLEIDELVAALEFIVKVLQKFYFFREMQDLKSGNQIKSGPLHQLSPFLDNKGVLRVKGRLGQSNLSFSQKFPIILPPKDHVVRLIYKQEHLRLFHGGPQLVLSNLRLKFWPVNGLRAIKKEIKNCATCHRFKAATAQQIMTSLPLDRTAIARPFLKVGVDFGGPILVKESRLRKTVTSKAYIALFICMVTKCIHLEVVSSLSTDAFLATLKRFIARRGNPSIIYSDNGSNFKGASNALQEIYLFFKENKDVVQENLSTKEITWKFIPPDSPHWGGLWEAGIKSSKFHLKRTIGNHLLTFEQLATLLCQIEAILNSRPLTALSTDPLDFSCLTPAHFLIGEALTAFPEKDVSDIADNRLDFWKILQKMRRLFWNRWSVEYLNKLQHRPKWTTQQQNLKVNDLVLLKEDNIATLNWKLARILEIIEGKDKNVRAVKLKTEGGIFTRPITKLSPLPFYDNLSAGGEDVGKTK